MNTEKPRAYSYIRMSTREQLKGHSRKRQLELSAKFIAENGLELVPNEQQLEDLGVSAFKGANVKDGALGRFLKAVEAGTIPRGSYLLVEALDRITRQDLTEALTLFLRITKAGIRLVTLQDNHVYSADSQTLLSDLILSLTYMSVAHDESEKKSIRVGKAWADKRTEAVSRSKPLTPMCPKWLQLSTDKSHYIAIPPRVTIVQSIFDETLAGIGILKIGKRLNERGVPVWGRSKGWHPSYIAKILASRAVIGEFQPCKIVGEKRKPIGDPIKSYFPPIIAEELFYRAQQSRSARRNRGGGRKGKYVTNLFSGLAICAYCRAHMMFNDKGPKPKGGTYLVCEAAKRGIECVSTGWRYNDFESSFLAFVERLDLPRIIVEDVSAKTMLDGAIQSLEGQLLDKLDEMERTYKLLENANVEFLAEKFKALQQKKDEIGKVLTVKREERERLELTEKAFYESKNEIKSLIARLQTPGKHDLYKLRSEVASRIKAMVSELKVAPLGDQPVLKQFLIDNPAYNTEANIESAKQAAEERWFQVRFLDGTILRVYPNKDDPLEYDSIRHIDTPDGSNPSMALAATEGWG